MQITVTIPDRLGEMLEIAVEETGETRSSLCSEYIRRGVQEELERINRLQNYSDRLKKNSKKAGDTSK